METTKPTLTRKQLAAYLLLCNSRTRMVGYGGAAGGGKSWLGCEWLLRCCLRFPGTRWFVGRNNIKDCRESVLVTFMKVSAAYGMEAGSAYQFTNDGILFACGSQVSLLDLTYYPYKDPLFNRLGSKEYTGGWVEEAGEVNRRAVEVLKSRIGRHLNDRFGLEPKMLLTFNPTKGYLYDTFYKPWRDGTLPADIAYVPALATDNGFLPSSYIDQLRAIQDPIVRKRLLLGLWDYEDDPSALCSFDAIEDLFSNEHVSEEGGRFLSADIAGKGRDRFVGLSIRGGVYRVSIDETYSPGRKVEQMLRDVAVRDAIPRSRTVVDADGLGSFVGSYITGIKEFHGGSAPSDRRYKNLKSECAFRLAEEVNNRRIRIVCSPEQRDRITQEFAALRQAHVGDDLSRLAIISKEEMKEQLGHSPDYLDAFIMAQLFRTAARPSSTPQAKVFSLSDVYNR